jgi:hypothetical protein
MRAPIAFLLLVVTGCGGTAAQSAADPTSTTSAAAATTTTATPPTTRSEQVGPAWYGDHLSVGDCFDDAFDDDGEYDYSEAPLIVPCDGPHDNEVTAVFTIPGEDHPGEDSFGEESDEVCAEAFASFVGVPYGEGPVDGFGLWPTAEEWRAGGRTAFCAVFLPSAQVSATLEGVGRGARPAELPDHLPVPGSAEYTRLADSEDGRRFVSFIVPDSTFDETVQATLRALAASGLTGTITGTTGTLTVIGYAVDEVAIEIVVRIPDDGLVRWEAYYPPR